MGWGCTNSVALSIEEQKRREAGIGEDWGA